MKPFLPIVSLLTALAAAAAFQAHAEQQRVPAPQDGKAAKRKEANQTAEAVRQLADQGDLVVLGEVAAVHDRTAKDGGMIYDVRVDEVIKGEHAEETLRFRSWGWVGYARYGKGETVLLFLRCGIGSQPPELLQLKPVTYVAEEEEPERGLRLWPLEPYLRLLRGNSAAGGPPASAAMRWGKTAEGLACGLGSTGPNSIVLAVRNVSDRDCLIWYLMSIDKKIAVPTQHLTLELRDAKGKAIPRAHQGTVKISGLGTPLRPGEVCKYIFDARQYFALRESGTYLLPARIKGLPTWIFDPTSGVLGKMTEVSLESEDLTFQVDMARPVRPGEGFVVEACTQPAAPVAKGGERVPDADKAKVAEAVNRFAFDLYAKLKDQEGNLFLSPYSISTALAMTYAGARGETADQMAEVLHFPANLVADPDRLHGAYAASMKELSAGGKERGYELAVANRLWGQKGYGFLPDFLGLLKTHYGAGLEQVDFARATEAARKTINGWVEEQTKDKIKELLKRRILTPDTVLVLTNAIYFKGLWAAQFDKKRTRDEDFFVAPERKVRGPMMRRTAEFGYLDTGDAQVLELGYKGDRLSMVVLLPREKDGLAEFEESFSAKKLADWLAKLRARKVIVALPKFKTTAEFHLNEPLMALGMTDAFTPGKADFSGMNGRKGLFISHVVHKAFVDVNEEGTEAAAATAVVLEKMAVAKRLPVFRADHPFFFLIRDTHSGVILFLGRVLDPTKN